MTPPEGEAQKTSPLTSSQFVLSLAGKTQSPQLFSAVDNPPLRCVIICGGFWSIGSRALNIRSARARSALLCWGIEIERLKASKVPIVRCQRVYTKEMKVRHQSIMRQTTEECNDRGRSQTQWERGPDLYPVPNVPKMRSGPIFPTISVTTSGPHWGLLKIMCVCRKADRHRAAAQEKPPRSA
jgi:hypothetical protein